MSIYQEKSEKIAIKIIEIFKYLTEEKHEFILSKQILRSGTSIGANIAESEFAVSKKDFLNKLSISLKECSETIYWLHLLIETKYLDEKQSGEIYNMCVEIRKMLIASTKTIKKKIGDVDD